MRALLALAGCLACARASADLPEYRPQAQVSGVIRTWGSDHMAVLMKNWEEGFRKVQPGVAFVDNLKGTASAQFGLHVNVADIALSGRQLFPYEYYGIYRRSQLYPVEIEVATGAFSVRGNSTALGVFVHPDNPLEHLTLRQLDGIYGDAYAAMSWRTAQVKPLALAESAEGPFVAPTRATVASRAYPLARSAYLYLAPDTATGDRAALDPKLREFVRYVLSRQGQADVAREGDHLPLTLALLLEQRRRLGD